MLTPQDQMLTIKLLIKNIECPPAANYQTIGLWLLLGCTVDRMQNRN